MRHQTQPSPRTTAVSPASALRNTRGNMARGTIKLPEDDYERHNEQRKKMGLTWAEYIDGESPELEDTIRRVVREELDN